MEIKLGNITTENNTLSSQSLPPPEVTTQEKYAVVLSCICSISSSLVIIITYHVWKELRTTSRKLVVYLSWSNLFLCLGYGYGALRDYQSNSIPTDCIIQSVISTFSQTSSFVWTVSVSVYLYLTLVKDDINKAENSITYFHIAAWACPAPVIAAATAYGKLGNDHSYTTVGWCWVKLPINWKDWTQSDILWMLITEKAWEFAAYIILPTLCILIRRQIQIKCATPNLFQHSQGDIIAMKQIDKKLLWIPLTFIFLRIWSTIRFIVALVDPSSKLLHDHSLMMMQGICSSGQGTVNFILFCILTRKVQRRVCKSFGNLSGCSKSTLQQKKERKILDNEQTFLKPNDSTTSLYYSGTSSTSSSVLFSSYEKPTNNH